MSKKMHSLEKLLLKANSKGSRTKFAGVVLSVFIADFEKGFIRHR